jgi:CBS domain-containing protein
MLALEIMTSPVVTASPDLPIKAAIQLLDRHDITAVPIVDDQQRLIGIVSEADLLRDSLATDPRAHVQPTDEQPADAAATVADAMTVGVLTVHENADAAAVARLMLDSGVKSIPVTRASHVVGIISRRDLIRSLAATDDQIRAEVDRLLTEAGLGSWTAEVNDGTVQLFGSGSERDVRIAMILARTVSGVSRVHAPGDVEHVATA